MAFQNLNNCFSFNVSANSTSLTKLSAFPCSEVIITNPSGSGQLLLIYDNNNSADAQAFAISAGNTVAIRGVTSSDALSAKFAAAPSSPNIYCRSQYYSFSTQSYA